MTPSELHARALQLHDQLTELLTDLEVAWPEDVPDDDPDQLACEAASYVVTRMAHTISAFYDHSILRL